MVRITRRMKKSAIGGTSVTLIPSTLVSESDPHVAISNIVITTPSTPTAAFFGTAVADGIEFEITLTRKS